MHVYAYVLLFFLVKVAGPMPSSVYLFQELGYDLASRYQQNLSLVLSKMAMRVTD